MSRKSILSSAIILICFGFFLLRIINLTSLPIFNDESTYIRYGMHELNEPDHQPYSLLIGKEPLDPYLYAVVGTMTGDLLVGGRMVTLVFGFFTLAGLYMLTKTLFGTRAALGASALYAIAPYTVFFDRLALMDSSVSTIAVWSLYLTYRILQKPQWRYGIALGLVMGIGMWIKTSALFYVFLPLICYAVFYFSRGDKIWHKAKLFMSAFFIALVVFFPIFSNQFYAVHLQLLQQYTYPLSTVFLFPFPVWWNNLVSIGEWLFFYLTPPIFLLAVTSLIFLTKKKKAFFVLLWFYLPLLYQILYAKLFTSRHVLLLTIPLFILAGYGFSLLWQKKQLVGIALAVCIAGWCLYDVGVLLTAPQQYPTLFADKAKNDVSQYFFGFSSGYGVIEAINYLKQASVNKRIVVLIRNDHGNPEDAVVAYLDYNSNIILAPMSEPTADVPIVFQKVGSSMPVYFVSRGAYYAGLEKYFAEEKKFTKPNDTEFVGVELLNPLAR
jgi:4-amino-4-deoxy-L-arabinose transferase-like glycosyltransferase